MTTSEYVRASFLPAAVLACTLIAGVAGADTTTERPGSILIFPKVVTGTRDTCIQITNTGNMSEFLRCFYLNGDTCANNDFGIALTKQQPTEWCVRSGRRVNPTDSQTGLDPGLIPPLPENFQGALVCAEVDASDAPLIRNAAKGEATLVDRSGAGTSGLLTKDAVSKYNAVAVQGITKTNKSNTLNLDDNEYSACPASLIVNFNREGTDQVIEQFGNGGRCVGGTNNGAPCNNNTGCNSGNCSRGQSTVETRVTVVPCSLDFEALTTSNFKLAFEFCDEDEICVSRGNGPFPCWGSFILSQALVTLNATPYLTGGIKSLVATGQPAAPVVGVAETFYIDSVTHTASAAANLHRKGVCSNTNQFNTCMRDIDCPTGTGPCVFTTASTIQLSSTP